jgi:predicted HicB family RNase H-like nuclease
MTKSRTMKWLEEQTGQTLEPETPSSDDTRHLSLRIPVSLFERLEALAAEHGETVSQLARRLLDRGVDNHQHPDREAIDRTIATLQQLRTYLPSSAA